MPEPATGDELLELKREWRELIMGDAQPDPALVQENIVRQTAQASKSMSPDTREVVSRLMNTAQFGMSGAALGSLFPGPGTAIGGVAGALGGLLLPTGEDEPAAAAGALAAETALGFTPYVGPALKASKVARAAMKTLRAGRPAIVGGAAGATQQAVEGEGGLAQGLLHGAASLPGPIFRGVKALKKKAIDTGADALSDVLVKAVTKMGITTTEHKLLGMGVKRSVGLQAMQGTRKGIKSLFSKKGKKEAKKELKKIAPNVGIDPVTKRYVSLRPAVVKGGRDILGRFAKSTPKAAPKPPREHGKFGADTFIRALIVKMVNEAFGNKRRPLEMLQQPE